MDYRLKELIISICTMRYWAKKILKIELSIKLTNEQNEHSEKTLLKNAINFHGIVLVFELKNRNNELMKC